jgi:CheY-like chemotaxis protein
VTQRILVVDDMQYLRDVQVMLLTEAGYDATAVGSAREALEGLSDEKPDLIVLDFSMPGMDGRQFLARLRATPEWEHLPVILATGRSIEGMAVDRACAVLPKPFTEAALLDLIRRLLKPAA